MNDYVRLEQRDIDGHYGSAGFPIKRRRGSSMLGALVMILGLSLLTASAFFVAATVVMHLLAVIGGAL